MLEKLGFQTLVEETITCSRETRVMRLYKFVLGIVIRAGGFGILLRRSRGSLRREGLWIRDRRAEDLATDRAIRAGRMEAFAEDGCR